MRKTVKDWIKLSEESLQVEKHDLQSNKKSMDYMYTVKIEGQVEWQEKTDNGLEALELQGIDYEIISQKEMTPHYTNVAEGSIWDY